MTGIGRRAVAIGAVTALLAGVGVGAANAATTHQSVALVRRDEGQGSCQDELAQQREGSSRRARSQAMKLREQRGPGSPREERNESKALQRQELRNHAEVRSTASASTHKSTAPKTGTTQKKR